MLLLSGISLVTGLAFSSLFFFRHLGPLDFWWWMSGQLVLFCVLGFLLPLEDKKYFLADILTATVKKIGLGFWAALFLYFLFFSGNFFLGKLLPASLNQVRDVYSFKNHVSGLRIAFLMSFIIGPGEETLWRWFLQGGWEKKLGRHGSFLTIAGLYTLVHLTSGNWVLVLAALVCGLFWGFLFFRYRSVLINIVSHTIWDLAVFLILPFS